MPDIPASHDIDFNVPFRHRLRFTEDVFGRDSEVLAELIEGSGEQKPRVQFWVDQNVADAQPDLKQKIEHFFHRNAGRLSRSGNVQIVDGGEAVKNEVHIVERMLKVMNRADLDRRSYVVVIGGGAVLDATGFAAAIAHRGIRLIRLPTTTLAQADSGVGVKNSINLFEKKNWVGTFAVPWAVVNDLMLLETLPDRDFVCGFTEAVKVALLKDPAMFLDLCRSAKAISDRNMQICGPLIRRSAWHHLQHITRGGDPFEMLEARPLDFGHWSAHKLEVMSGFGLRHGEAVGIGVAVDTAYSTHCFGLPVKTRDAVLDCLENFGLTLDHPALHDTETLFAGLEEFRQHLGGRLTLTMLKDAGKPFEVHEVDESLMRRSIEEVAARIRRDVSD